MSNTLALDARDESTLSRTVLESLPQSLYRALPWPTHTIDSCVKIVAEAQRMNNPRRVRAWIDFECSVSNREELVSALDSVLHQMTLPGDNFAERVRFANKLRQDALDHIRATGAIKNAASSLDPHASVLADGLIAAMRLHDPSLADHAEATAALAQRLAIDIGADADTTARTMLAARLHDIGKMRISRAIFAKPLPLTAAERAEVCAYPLTGAQTLAALPALAAIAPIVAAHREWVDGNGYPDRRSQHEIPLESRMVAIADSYHTMTLPRPYRNARSANDAAEELIRCSGTRFDAELVTSFVSMVGYRGRIARSA